MDISIYRYGEMFMKRYMILVLFVVVLLSSCSTSTSTRKSPTATPTQATSEVEPEPTATQSLISGNTADYLLAVDDFNEPYLLTGFPATNESLVENWGADLQAIFEETGRQEGFIGIYDLEPTEMVAPPRLLIVVESFDSVQGAKAFIGYDFPGDFRGGIYHGEALELGAAERALLAMIENPNGDDPNGLKMTIVFQYRNVNVIVEGQGTADNVCQYYLEQVATSILEKLETGL
jgi:hypothetical protein